MKLLGLKLLHGCLVGYWNHKRIVGVEFKFKLFLDFWVWLPVYSKWSSSINWLCFWVSWGWLYGRFVEETLKQENVDS